MNENIENLLFHVERSQLAYQYYTEKKYFHLALRIYKANKIIYSIINENGCLWDAAVKEKIIFYIFHLEDWFEQFEYLEKLSTPKLEEVFVFEKLENSLAFPNDIVDSLKSLIK